jgi:hypothetical protein
VYLLLLTICVSLRSQFNLVYHEARQRVDGAGTQVAMTSSNLASARRELYNLRAATFDRVLGRNLGSSSDSVSFPTARVGEAESLPAFSERYNTPPPGPPPAFSPTSQSLYSPPAGPPPVPPKDAHAHAFPSPQTGTNSNGATLAPEPTRHAPPAGPPPGWNSQTLSPGLSPSSSSRTGSPQPEGAATGRSVSPAFSSSTYTMSSNCVSTNDL